MSGLTVTSISDTGMCATVPPGKPFYCDPYIRQNVPIYLPPNSSINTVADMDQQVQYTTLRTAVYDNCKQPFFNYLCASSFQPCENETTPIPVGVCQSACDAASSCSPGKIKGACTQSFKSSSGIVTCISYSYTPVPPSPISPDVCKNGNFVPDTDRCTGHTSSSQSVSKLPLYALVATVALPILAPLIF